MQVIVDFLSGIGDAILSAFEWLIGTVQDIAYLSGLLIEYVQVVPTFFTWLPESTLAILVVTLGVLVILRLIGRD